MENNSVRFGLIAGLGVIIYSFGLYFIDSELTLSGYTNVSWLIYLFFMWKAASTDKAENNGFISFRGAFSSAFVVFVIAGLFTTIFQYLLLTTIDPSLADLLQDRILESFQESAEAQGMSEGSEQYEQMLEMTLKWSTPSVMVYSIGYLVSLLGGGIAALIIAAIIKKDKPDYMNVQDETEHLVEE